MDTPSGMPTQSPTHAPPRSYAPALFVGSITTVWGFVVADLVRALLDPNGARVPPSAAWSASLHLFALVGPVAISLFGAGWASLAVARRLEWLDPIRERLSSWQRLSAHDPEALSTGTAAIVGVAVFVALLPRFFVQLTESFHRMDLAGVLFAPLTLGLAVGCVLVAAIVRAALLPLARRGRRVASAASVLVLVIIAAAIGLGLLLARYPELAETYGIARLVGGPVGVVLFVVATLLADRRTRRVARPARWLSGGAALLLAVFALSAATYGSRQSVRNMIEQRTLMGRSLVRTYARLSDRDRDGFAALFGGGDCDDGDADVHPGARDEPGDGVDADCFRGDGLDSPIAELGDGRFASLASSGLPASPSFVVITVDALRPDILDAEPAIMPRVAALCREGVWLRTTIAQSSRSIRSIPSMWTGHYASQIAYGPEFQFPAVEDENHLLAELLGERGYRTSATVGTNYFSRVAGFAQGFEQVYFDPEYQPHPRRVVDRALSELDRLSHTGQPFFLWAHLFTVHAPHRHVTLPADIDSAPDPYRVSYEAAAALADVEVARLLDAIDGDAGLRARTVVVVASDHGESIYEHDVVGHSTTLYDTEILSTLVIRAPGATPRTVSAPVALMDVAPTLANLAGASAMPERIAGHSLVPILLGEEPDEERAIVSELLPDGHYPWDIKILREGRYKLHWWVRDGRYALYDLGADPGERTDLADDQPERAADMLGRLRAFMSTGSREAELRERVRRDHVRREPFGPMSNPLDLRIPGVGRMTGFDLPARTLRPGEVIPLRLFFAAEQETSRDLYFELGAYGPPGVDIGGAFHGSHYPVYAQYHTDQWSVGEHIEDPLQIVVPPQLPHPIHLRFVLWITENGRRVPFVLDGEEVESTTLFEIDVH